jgi:hypothetical protein
MGDVDEVVSDAADNDHGRYGPHKQDWHFRLLLNAPPDNASLLALVPGAGQ